MTIEGWAVRTCKKDSRQVTSWKVRISFAAFVVLLFLCSRTGAAQEHWVGTWAASQQLVEPRNSLSEDDLRDATLRQIVHVTIGGEKLRIRLSNRFGTTPLKFTAVHVARAVSPASAKTDSATDLALTFSGDVSVTIPAGADYLSDPVALSVAPLSDLAITLYIETPPSQQTGHPGSRANSYVAHGNLVSAPDLPSGRKVEHWYFIAGVDVAVTAPAAAIVTLGDSITDGHGATTDGNNRWPDLLARRLQGESATRGVAVLNAGIGGNRLLLDGIGPNALARFDHDVLTLQGTRAVIVLEGVNDLGMLTHNADVPQAEHNALIQGIIGAYQQMIARAHAHDIRVVGATIMPFVGSAFYQPGPITEADRQAVNKWIRTPGHFDRVIDFDQVTRDPEHPDRLLAAFDSGDHLHPSHAGYAAMADAIPLSLFAFAEGPRLAITFDDLPAHGPLPPGETRMEVISKIISALQQARVPPTYGFTNGRLVEQQPADSAVLDAWKAAGNPLGNHSWSHMSLNQHSLTEFEADVTVNQPLLEKLMKDGDWRWFRFPFLAEGDTPEKRAGIRTFLAQHGYKVAGVTMSFGDYMWNEPYARCRAKGDNNAIVLLENSYLEAADESITYYRSMSQSLLGRDIPYVLLMHVGALDAEMLPRLLDLYRSKGFRFVSLAEAESDDFYKNDIDLKIPPGVDSLEGAMAEHHLAFPPRWSPAIHFDELCK